MYGPGGSRGYWVFEVLRIGGSFARAGLAAATVAAATLTFAAPASAVEYVYVASATPTGPTGGFAEFGAIALAPGGTAPAGREGTFLMAPFVLKGNNGQGAGVGYNFGNVLAFCVDFFVDMPIDEAALWAGGVNTIDTQYEVGSLPDHGAAEVVSLVNYGTDLWRTATHDSTLYIKLAAVQGAIWQVETGLKFEFAPGSGDFDPTDMNWDTDPAANALIQQYASLDFGGAVVSHDAIRAIFNGDETQGLAYSLRTSVPEPATWGLMIGGFFVAGAMVRRARRESVPAT
jgi:hypothetical protein